MQTIAYQKRSEELNEKQPELHPETYKRLMEFASENDGFTVCNIVNEALAQFLSVGDLARTQELVEGRLDSRGVPLPPGSQEETEKKIFSVAEKDTEWHQVFDVHSVGEWKTAKDEVEGVTLKLPDGEEKETDDYTIYLNTNYDLWDAVKEAPSYRSYVVNAAVDWWFNLPYNGSCDHLLSLHQLLAATDGEEVSEEQATEWVSRRLRGIRKESDGDYHTEWESVFSSGGSSSFNISEVRPSDEIELTEEVVIEARKNGEVKQGANRAGVLAAVCRNKEQDVWTRSDVAKVNDRINADMQTDSIRDGYVDKALPHINTEGVEFPAKQLQNTVEDIVEETVKEVDPAETLEESNRLKRTVLKEDKLAFIREEKDSLNQYYESYEEMGGDVLSLVVDALQADSKKEGKKSNKFALMVINSAPEEMWESEEVQERFSTKLQGMRLTEPVEVVLKGRGIEL